MFELGKMNGRKISSEFGISELREIFIERGGGGRVLAGS